MRAYAPADIEQGRAVRTSSAMDQMVMDGSRSAELSKTGLKVGVVGYCLGGTMAWLAATRIPGVAAAVGYYGGGIETTASEQLSARWAPLRQDRRLDPARALGQGPRGAPEAARPTSTPAPATALAVTSAAASTRRATEAGARADHRLLPRAPRIAATEAHASSDRSRLARLGRAPSAMPPTDPLATASPSPRPPQSTTTASGRSAESLPAARLRRVIAGPGTVAAARTTEERIHILHATFLLPRDLPADPVPRAARADRWRSPSARSPLWQRGREIPLATAPFTMATDETGAEHQHESMPQVIGPEGSQNRAGVSARHGG